MENNEIITLYPVASLKTVTLTETKWSAIRTAVLCLACDEQLKGNDAAAEHYLAAHAALKEALKA
jgi:hypothetical protein